MSKKHKNPKEKIFQYYRFSNRQFKMKILNIKDMNCVKKEKKNIKNQYLIEKIYLYDKFVKS